MVKINHEYTNEIVCPHCGYEFMDSWEFEQDTKLLSCVECGKEFRYIRESGITTYSTEKTY